MTQSSAAKMLFQALVNFLKGGSDAIPQPTKTIPSIFGDAVALSTDIPALPTTSFFDFNSLPRPLTGNQQISHAISSTSPSMTWPDPSFQTDIFFLLFLGLMAIVLGIIVGAWISSMFYESGYQYMIKLTNTYKTLLKEAHAEHKDWKALQANHTCLRTRRLQHASEIIKAGVTYVSNLPAAYDNLNEQFYTYMVWADEQLEAAGYDQAVILSALSLYGDVAGDLGKHDRELAKSKKEQEITHQEELLSLRNSLDDKQREVDTLLETEKSLREDNRSLTDINDKYLEKIDEQVREAEASNDRIRKLEAVVEKRPSILQSDDKDALQKRGQDVRYEIGKDPDSASTNDKAHEANDESQKQQSIDETGDGSQDILSKLNLSPEDLEALMANTRQKVAAEQHHKENVGRKRRRQNQRKKRENGEHEGAEEKAKEEAKAE